MRTMMLALIALGAMMVPGAAETPTPAAGSPEVFWVFTLAIEPAQYGPLTELVSQIVAAAEKEPGTLEYDWNIGADRKTLIVIERYADSQALLQHGKDFGPFAKRFFTLAKPVSLVVFGTPDAEAKKAIAGLRPVYMTTFDGFSR